MTVNISPELQKKFQAHRVVMTAMKNDGNQSRTVSHNDVMELLFKHSPISKEVEKYMQANEASLKAIAENRSKINIKEH